MKTDNSFQMGVGTRPNKPTIVYNGNGDWKGIVDLVDKAQIEINKMGIKTKQGEPLNLMELVTKKAAGKNTKENITKAIEIISRYVNIINIHL